MSSLINKGVLLKHVHIVLLELFNEGLLRNRLAATDIAGVRRHIIRNEFIKLIVWVVVQGFLFLVSVGRRWESLALKKVN